MIMLIVPPVYMYEQVVHYEKVFVFLQYTNTLSDTCDYDAIVPERCHSTQSQGETLSTSHSTAVATEQPHNRHNGF